MDFLSLFDIKKKPEYQELSDGFKVALWEKAYEKTKAETAKNYTSYKSHTLFGSDIQALFP